MNKFQNTIDKKYGEVSSAIHFCGDNSGANSPKDLSRLALRELLCQQNLSEIKDSTTLYDFTQIQELPDYWASLTHTACPQGAAKLNFSAAAVAQKKRWAGIGIDLEWAKREMKQGAQKYFANAYDHNCQHFGFWSSTTTKPNPWLILWSKKEAAFKSLRQEQHRFKEKHQRELLLKDIWINQHFFGLGQSPKLILGEINSIECFYFEPFILNVAHCYNSPLPKAP